MKASEQVRILAVADAADVLQSIAEVLSGPEQRVVQARTGRDALRHLLRDDFAAIVIDAGIKEVGGLEIAARIRKRRRCEHTPIIFLTNGGEIVEREAVGGCDYMCLPVEPELLRNKIGGLVELFQKTEAIRHQAAHRVQLAREQAARQMAEKAMRRSALLSEASRLLSRSLDFDATLMNLHRAVVPALADACQPVLYDPNGDLWFAPIKMDQEEGESRAQSSTSRIQTVSAVLTQAVCDAVESGHAQSIKDEDARSVTSLRNQDGWSSVIIAPLIARDIPMGAIICCRQSARRRFQPAEIALMEELASRAATALDNAQLYQTIRDGERRKDEFLAMLGHELRNPLAAITNAGELTRLLNPKEATFQETLEIIRQQASLMKRLVDDLLDVSRITSGRVQLKKSILNAGDIMARVAEAIGPLLTSRGHSLHLTVPPAEIRLEADPFRLEQILSNLMVNAAKYTDPGGKIWFNVSKRGNDVCFCVRDNGMGIGPDLLPNVFDLFSQANRSLHRSEGGLGIGLTIVKGLTELHGGRVTVASEGIGRGAEFHVYLPATTSTAAKMSAKGPVDLQTSGRKRRVLVVEDQPSLLHVTVALLKILGHDVRAASNGPEALLAVKEYHPEIVFLDIGLPGMDGYEVAQSLRAELGDATPTLVAMTGYGQHEVNRHAEKVRFDHHLVKPADIAAIRALLC